MTLGSLRTTLGEPSAIFSPWSSTTMRSEPAHDDLHVVLDEDDGHAFVADLTDERHQGGGLLGVHAGGRLVEEQQLGLGGQRPGDLQPSLRSIGQALGEFVATPSQAHVLQQREALVAHGLLLLDGATRAGHHAEQAALRAAVLSHHHVLERRHLVEQADVLEGAGDAELGDLRREHPGDVAVHEADGA